MKSFNQYQTLLTEDTTPSTKFEGVLVDCWNLGGNEKVFREKILGSPNTKEFLALNAKGWGTSGKTGDDQIDVLWSLAKVMKKKIKV